jgi:photosystem II stability/assembly factor-like uncharacterized protein
MNRHESPSVSIILTLFLLVGAGCGSSGRPAGESAVGDNEAAPPTASGLRQDGAPSGAAAFSSVDQDSGTAELLQAISIVDDQTVWVSGHGATYARTVDGGESWVAAVMPDAEGLQFRDVHAVDAQTAYLMSAGTGDASRIYKTTNGGESWTLQHINPDADGFYDCMDFWGPDHGALYGDSVEGQVVILTTSDGGETWERVSSSGLPDALPGEGGFAASGTCLVAGTGGRAWIGTGASSPARVLLTEDGGASWSAVDTPVIAATSAGITSVAFHDEMNGMVVGGDINDPEGRFDNIAVTSDGGRTWILAGGPAMTGAAYGSSYVPGAPTPTAVIVGPSGVDYSVDNGESWQSLDSREYWAVAFHSPSAGWAVGREGRITKLEMQ